MVNILRMDLYRLVRSTSFWVCLGVMVLMTVFSIGMLWYASTPDFVKSLQMGTSSAGMSVGLSNGQGEALSESDIAQLEALTSTGSLTSFVGGMLIKGGALSVLFVIFITIFLASEFESGFSKNVFASHPNRMVFLGARVIEILVLAAVFVVVATLTTLAATTFAGFNLEAEPVSDLLLWGGLTTLILAAFATICAAVVLITRKMAAAIVAGVVLASGLIGMLIDGVLSLFPSISHLATYTLTSCMTSLGQYGLADAPGALSAGHIALVCLAFLVICAAASAVALKKKDI